MSLEEHYVEEVTSLAKKTGDLFRSKYGLWVLGVVSFADSALGLPIVTDPFLVAYIISNRARALIATIVTIVTSVVGGLMTYLLALFFIDLLLPYLSPGALNVFNELVLIFDQGAFALAFLGALTPVPYTFVAIVAGSLKSNVLMFVLGSIAGRFIRFTIVGYFTYRYGEKALELARRNLILSSVIATILVGLFLFYKLYL